MLTRPNSSIPVKISNINKKKAFDLTSPDILLKSLNEIEKDRITFTQQMLKRRLGESVGEKKKLVKKNKRKRSDQAEHDDEKIGKKSKDPIIEEAKKSIKKVNQAKSNEHEVKSQSTSPSHKQERKFVKKNKLKEKSEEVLSSIIKASTKPIEVHFNQSKASSDDLKKVIETTQKNEGANKIIEPIKDNVEQTKDSEVKEEEKKEIGKTDAVQDEYRHGQKSYEYRDQYQYYQNIGTGGYFKRGSIKHRHPQTIYKKKLTRPSPNYKNIVERKTYVNKSFSESLKESDDEKVVKVDFKSEKKSLVQANPVPTEVSEEIPLPKNPHKSRTYSITSEEGIKRIGLGGILLRAESSPEDTENGKDLKSTEGEITEEWSELEFYNYYNPLSKFDLKLPNPFTVKEESEEEEKHHMKTDISLFEAYKSANSLLGGRSFVTEQKTEEKFVSPLSELRGDSVEYIPSLQRRFIGGNDKSEDNEYKY
jgi:hypothetical protein